MFLGAEKKDMKNHNEDDLYLTNGKTNLLLQN